MSTLSKQDALKRDAAIAAIDELVAGTVVGVGTGSTVNFFIKALAQQKKRFIGTVSSSSRSTQLLQQLGVAVLELDEVVARQLPVPVYVDGADEIDINLCMIKGGGGALTREKIVASLADRFVCVADQSKVVSVLGKFPLPVEVIGMAQGLIGKRFAQLGGRARLRSGFLTDNGNPILDVSGLTIDDPVALEREVNQWPGVVTVGLFAIRRAQLALIASPSGVRKLTG